jgi:hypothetical protein
MGCIPIGRRTGAGGSKEGAKDAAAPAGQLALKVQKKVCRRLCRSDMLTMLMLVHLEIPFVLPNAKI